MQRAQQIKVTHSGGCRVGKLYERAACARQPPPRKEKKHTHG